jgi:hypothetical protein
MNVSDKRDVLSSRKGFRWRIIFVTLFAFFGLVFLITSIWQCILVTSLLIRGVTTYYIGFQLLAGGILSVIASITLIFLAKITHKGRWFLVAILLVIEIILMFFSNILGGGS